VAETRHVALHRILSVEDHELFRDGLRHVLTDLAIPVELMEASTAAAARALLDEGADDFALVLLDLNLPDAAGIPMLRELRADFPTLPIAILSAAEDPHEMRQAMDLDVVGYIPKSSPRGVLASALRLILEGGVYVPRGALAASADPREQQLRVLTPRQRQVSVLLAKGLTNKEIAATLGMRPLTAKTHVEAILDVLGVSNRTEAVLVLVQLGVVEA
jgi:DNA-binding NarL/FixJ family response regulator